MGVRIYQAIKPDGSVLWEEERPLEWLEKKRRAMPPSLFNAQYQNDPSGMRGVKFDVEWLRFYDDTSIPPLHKLIGVQGGDPATSESESANYFGHCTAAKDPDTGIVYVLDFAFGKIPAPKHLEFLYAQYKAWKMRGLNIVKVILETNGPQQATTQNLIVQTRNDPRGAMPIDTVIPKGSKEQRYDAIIPYLSNGTVLFKGERRNDQMFISNHSGFKEFQQEYSAFPRGGRDDVLDALWIAVNDLTVNVDAAAIMDDEPISMTQIRLEAERDAELEGIGGEEREKFIYNRLQDLSQPQVEETARDRVMRRSGRQSLFHRGLGVM